MTAEFRPVKRKTTLAPPELKGAKIATNPRAGHFFANPRVADEILSRNCFATAASCPLLIETVGRRQDATVTFIQ